MADFNVAEFFRQKRLQDKINQRDPNYNPDSSIAWLEHAVKFPTSPNVSSEAHADPRQRLSDVVNNDRTANDPNAGQIQFSQFTPEASRAIGSTQPATNDVTSTPFQAPSVGPEETAYRQQLGQTPLRQDYHPGKLRSILGGIAGVGVGLNTSDPAKAHAAESQVTDAPYNKQLEEFNQKLGLQKSASDLEVGDVTRASKQAEELARTGAENSRAGAEEARRQDFQYKNSPEGRDFQLQLAGVKKPQEYEGKLKDGTISFFHKDLKTGKMVDNQTGQPVDLKAFAKISDPGKSLRESQENIKTPFELWLSQNPDTDVEEWFKKPENKPLRGEWEEFRDEYQKFNPHGTIRQAVKDFESIKAVSRPEPGPYLVDPNTNTLFRGKSGQVLPLGVTTPQQSGAETTRKSKAIEEMEADRDFVNGYIEGGTPNGPDDEALLERFFNVTKPSTGFRMNQAQIKLLTDLRSLKSRIKAGVGHLTGGTLFDDTQRKQIVKSINDIIDAKTRAIKGTVAPVGGSQNSNDGWSVKVVK